MLYNTYSMVTLKGGTQRLTTLDAIPHIEITDETHSHIDETRKSEKVLSTDSSCITTHTKHTIRRCMRRKCNWDRFEFCFTFSFQYQVAKNSTHIHLPNMCRWVRGRISCIIRDEYIKHQSTIFWLSLSLSLPLSFSLSHTYYFSLSIVPFNWMHLLNVPLNDIVCGPPSYNTMEICACLNTLKAVFCHAKSKLSYSKKKGVEIAHTHILIK